MGTNLPVLQKSLLGWIVVGEYTPSSQSCLMSVDQSIEVDELASVVQKIWECEEISRPKEATYRRRGVLWAAVYFNGNKEPWK